MSLHVEANILAQPVRRSQPARVAVRVTNSGTEPIVVNARLAVGYRESQARELFVEIFKPGSDDVVSQPTQLYQRSFSPPDDYRTLQPGASLASEFDLFDWYALPGPGSYELVVYYTADEPLASPPDNVLRGTHASARVALEVA
jgi:hypothetical protein